MARIYHFNCRPEDADNKDFRTLKSKYESYCHKCKGTVEPEAKIAYFPDNEPGKINVSSAAALNTRGDVDVILKKLQDRQCLLEDRQSKIEDVLRDLQLVQRPELIKLVPVEHRTEMQRLLSEAVDRIPAMPAATVQEAALMFSGNEVQSAEEPF